MATMDALLEQVQARAPEVAAYGYVAVWALSDMLLRMRASPAQPRFADIRFPHTSLPLFSPEEAAQLEVLFARFLAEGGPALLEEGGPAKADEDEDEEQEQGGEGGQHAPPQSGGGPLPFSPAQVREASAQAGTALGMALDALPPEAFSVDGQFHTVTRLLDDADKRLGAWSQQVGLRAVEDAAPDLKGLVPVPFVGAVPYLIPARAVLPLVTSLLEGLRAAAALAPFGGTLLTLPPTLALFLLDLGRGQVYHALYTLLALLGAGGFLVGFALKAARNTLSFLAPDLREALSETAFASSKSFVVGASLWVFVTLAPDPVRAPLQGLLEAVRTQIEALNASLEGMEASARAALPPNLQGRVEVTLPRLPADKVPTMATLYEVQGVLHDPRVWCQPEVLRFVDDLRAQPPLALFLDLLRIPGPADPARPQQCAAVQATPLAAAFAPRVTVL